MRASSKKIRWGKMQYEINYLVLLTITVYSLLITFFSIMLVRMKIHKTYIIFLSLGIYAYSGIGLSFLPNAQYIFKYFLFYFCVFISYIVIVGLKTNETRRWQVKLAISSRHLTILTIIFFSVYFVRLVHPDFLLYRLIFPPISSIDDIFNRREALRDTPILEIFRLLNISTLPFFMMKIGELFERRKHLTGILLVVLWIYLEYITLGYISRNEILVYIAFITMIIFNYNKTNISDYGISAKMVLFGFVIAILMIPFLLSYESSRMGVQSNSISMIDSTKILFLKEFDYPKYFDFSLKINAMDNILKYFKWFVTLPIPRAISFGIKSNVFEVNRYFTENLTGVFYGNPRYSVVLPSILGESFIIYGRVLFWIHGIFIGSVIGLISVFLTLDNRIGTLNLYLSVLAITIGRGGTAGFFGLTINSLVLYFLLVLFLHLVEKKELIR